MSLMQREKEKQLDREFAYKFDNWKNLNGRFREDYPKRTEGYSALVAMMCFCGIGVAIVVAVIRSVTK